MSRDRPSPPPRDRPPQPPVRVAICGGGTAGHVYPALAVAHALKEPDTAEASAELLYLHGPSRRDHELMAHANIEHKQLDVGPIRGTAPHRLALNMLRLGRATAQAGSAL